MACKHQYHDKGKTWCSKDDQRCPFKIPAEYKCLKALPKENKERGV